MHITLGERGGVCVCLYSRPRSLSFFFFLCLSLSLCLSLCLSHSHSLCLSPVSLLQMPSGMLARGHYKVKSKFIDDDGESHLAWEWTFDLKKKWEA